MGLVGGDITKVPCGEQNTKWAHTPTSHLHPSSFFSLFTSSEQTTSF